MNISLALTKARKELEEARTKAGEDERTARIARQTARAAKIKLKQARKLSKLAKKSARKADDQAEATLEALDRIQGRLEKLEKRARKHGRKGPEKSSQKKLSSKPAIATKKAAKSRHPAKLKVVRIQAKRGTARPAAKRSGMTQREMTEPAQSPIGGDLAVSGGPATPSSSLQDEPHESPGDQSDSAASA